MDIKDISTNLTLSELGIWESPGSEAISYTENGHELIKECEEHSFWFRHRSECVRSLINQYEIQSILDVGGGNGNLSKQLQANGTKCTLLEPAEQAIHNARLAGLNSLICSSLTEAMFRNDSINSIGLFDVLEHIEDDHSFIKEVYRILEPGGRLFLTVPSYQFLFSAFDKEVGHFRRYSLNELKQKLRSAGFHIDYKTYLFSFLPLPMFFQRKIFKSRPSGGQNRRNQEHLKGKHLIGSMLKLALHPEKWFIHRRWFIPFGSSCLVVAQKPSFQ